MLKRLCLGWLSDSVNHFDHYMPVCMTKKNYKLQTVSYGGGENFTLISKKKMRL